MEDARRRSVAFLSRLRSDGPAALAGWTPASAFWTACGLEDLADFRFHSITAAVRELAEATRARSLAVGLDLFSPSLAPLVGQDYGALGSLCDWVKPMTYRFAAGPAGLPLEIASLWGALGTLGPRTGEGGARSVLERALGFELPASEEDLLRRGLPASVISSELDSVARAGPKAGAKVYAGIEAVQIPRFGIRVRPPDVQASVRAAMQAEAGRADGVILSWDLMAIPDENLRAAAEAVQ